MLVQLCGFLYLTISSDISTGDYVYQFPNKGDPVSEFDYQTIMNKNATVEDYPMWKTETLFASDNHHLSPTGHALVAELLCPSHVP